MEKQIKSIPWIGNVIQKFEDMCLEVDEVMRQVFFYIFLKIPFNLFMVSLFYVVVDFWHSTQGKYSVDCALLASKF